jgi:hypothetical protein
VQERTVPTVSISSFFRCSAQARRWANLIPAAIFVAAMAACGGSDNSTGPKTAASIVLSSAGGSVAAGGTKQFSAVVKDAGGNTLSLTPTWSIVHGGGTVNSSGLFTAGDSAATFTNTVKVAVGSVSATSSVTVTAGALAAIHVTPASVSIAAGATQQYVAAAVDAHGNAVAIPDRVWSVAAGGGTIDTSGLFTAGAAGTYANTVTATSGSMSGTASVTVTSVGGPVASIEITLNPGAVGVDGTKQYTVVAKDADGNVVPIVPAPVWSVVAGGGTIDPGTGLFTAGTVAGDFVNTIHVVSGTFSASVSITITAGALATIAVSPGSVSLAGGATQQYTAVGKDAHNNVVTITPAWTIAAGGGTIDGSTGLFTAGTTAGDFTNTVTATSGAVSGTASVSVTSGTLASITVTPSSPSLAAGAQQQFVAVGHDAGNNVVAITPTWSVAAGGGTIDPSTGLFTSGTTAGTFTNTVTATSGAISGTASVTVTPGALTTITITPSPATLAVHATQQFTVTGTDANNNTVPVPSPVWQVFAGGGTIDANGLFTAGSSIGTFTNTIGVTSGTLATLATVTVTAGPVATITVLPANATVAKGSNTQYTATAKDADGNVVAATITWITGSTGGGNTSNSGNFHASNAGVWPAQIQATTGTGSTLITGSTGVTITP